MNNRILSPLEMHLIADKGYSPAEARKEAKKLWYECARLIESKGDKTPKSDFATWKNENVTEWKLGLVTEGYIFYCNFGESDDNGNTKMYDRKMNLISDNYFAKEALLDELKEIYEKQTIVYYMSPEIAKEIQIREEENLF